MFYKNESTDSSLFIFFKIISYTLLYLSKSFYYKEHFRKVYSIQWLSPFFPVVRLKSDIFVALIGEPMNEMLSMRVTSLLFWLFSTNICINKTKINMQ